MKSIATKWLDDLNKLLGSHEYEQIGNLFHQECWWRDLLSLKLDHSLLHTTSEIKSSLEENGRTVGFSNFKLSPEHEPALQNPIAGVTWIQAYIDYETKIGRGKGLFRLLPNTAGAQAQWKW